MLKDSINLYGEAVMRLNAAPGGPADQRRGARGPAQAARRVGRARRRPAARGRLGAVAPRPRSRRRRSLCSCKRVHEPAADVAVRVGLPVAGVDGSLAARMKDTKAAGQPAREDRHDEQHPQPGRLREDRATASSWPSWSSSTTTRAPARTPTSRSTHGGAAGGLHAPPLTAREAAIRRARRARHRYDATPTASRPTPAAMYRHPLVTRIASHPAAAARLGSG